VTTGRTIDSVNGAYNAATPAAHCVAFSPDDAHIAYVGDDNAVKILDGRTGAVLKSLKGHDGLICTVAFSLDSKRLVSGGEDKTVKLWDIDAGKDIATFKGHTARINGVALSPDGTRVVSASDDLTIKIWETQSGQEIMSLNGHLENVVDVAFSPDGKQIASSGNDHTIRIWDAWSGKEVYRMKGHVAGVTGIAFSPDGKRIVSTSFDRAIKLWNTQTGREVLTIEKSPQGFHGVGFSPDGSRIAAGAVDGFIKFFDAPTGHEVTTLRGHTDTVIHFSFSDDGSQIYSESRNEKLFWDLATKQRAPDATFDPPATHTQVSPEGRWLINADRNNLLLIDLEYKNTPHENNYCAAKVRFDPHWHHEQATAATTATNWYAATFHFAWLTMHDPEGVTFDEELQSSFQKLRSQFAQEELDIELLIPTVVRQALKLSLVKESARVSNPAELARQESTANVYGVKRLHALLVGVKDFECRYLGMRQDRVGIQVETESNSESIFAFTIEKKDNVAILTSGEGRFLTARGEAVVLTDTLEEGSRWVIRNPLKTNLDPNDGWFSLESASDPGRFLRHFSLFVYAHKKSELTPGQASLFLPDASWRFVDAQ
jgi:WD40 repeat protein